MELMGSFKFGLLVLGIVARGLALRLRGLRAGVRGGKG